jgi:hypothetical protein
VLVFTRPEPEKAARKKTAARVYILSEILIFAVLMILTMAVLRPIQQGVKARMEEVRDHLIGGMETYLGREITYSSMGPSIFGALDIRNIRISGSGPEPLLSIARFRVSYSLMDLIRGRPQAIRSVRIDRPVISLNLERDRDFIDLFGDSSFSLDFLQSSPLGNFADLLPDTVLFRIRNGRGILDAGPHQYRAQNLNLDIQVEDQQIVLQGKGNAGVSLAGFLNEPFTAQIALGISGVFSSALDRGEARITIPSLSGDLFRIRSLGFNFTLTDQALALRKTGGGDFDLSLDYGIQTGNLLARFNCNKFLPGDFLSLQGPWKQYNPWLALALSGGVFLEQDGRGKMTYQTSLSGTAPAGMPIEDGSFVLNLQGNESAVNVERFYFDVPRPRKSTAGTAPIRGSAGFQGRVGLKPLAPSGRLSFSDFSLTGTGGLTADISLSSPGREINFFGETLSLGAVELSAFDLSLFPSTGQLGFALSALRFTGVESYGAARLSSLSLDGSLDYKPRQVEASLRLDSFSTADLSEMASPFIREPLLPLPVKAMQNNLAITTEVFLTTDFAHILYNAPRFVAAYEGSRNVIGFFSLSGTDQRFDLTEGRIIWADEGILFTGYADFSDSREINFSMTANYQDLSYFFEGLVLDSRSLNISGSYGFQAHITSSAGGAYSGYIEAPDIPIPFRGQYARLSLSSSLRYVSSGSWRFNLERLEIRDLFTPLSPAASFRISGILDQDGALFPDIGFEDGRAPLGGTARIAWNRDFSGFSGTLMMSAGEGEQYNLEAAYRDKQFDARVSISRAQLSRFLTLFSDAQADGSARISWNSVESFRADMELASLSGRIQDTEFRASAWAEMDNETFTLRDLRLDYGGLQASIPLFRVNRAGARAEAEAAIRGSAGGRWLDLAFTAGAAFDPSQSWFDFSRALENLEGTVRVSEARLDALRSEGAFDFLFSRKGPVLSLSGGPRDMLRLQIDGNGDFYAGLSSPFPIRGSVTGTLTSKTIDAQTSDLYIDLKSLWNFIPGETEVVLDGGYVTAALEIRGPLGDPEFFGRAQGNSLRIQVPGYISRDILPVPLSLTIEGSEMYFGPVPATVGGGAGMVSGWFRFDRWIPGTFNIDIAVPHETPIPFDFDIAGFLASGLASGNLKLAMEDRIFIITGNLTADETEIGLNAEKISRAQGTDMFANTLTPVMVDLNVSTGKRVEFIWPSTEFPMLQANADMGTRVNVVVDTLARRFSLNSDVKIRSGELFYFERSFYIREGLLSFRENEIQFNPRISARAEVRDRTNEGPVTISMIVENAPLLSFTARFESSPPLSQVEVFALLGQNLTGGPAEESGTFPRAIMGSAGDILARFSIVRHMERQIRDFLRLDMFSFRTQMFQNAVSRAVELQDPVDRIGGVGNYFDNTTVFLGKYIGRDMFVQSMLSLRYDKNKTDWWGLTPELNIGLEMESPLFNIRWDFVPTHPENWYMDGNSITLTWRRSF